MVKKTVMSVYDRTRRDGLIAINLKDDDDLLACAACARASRSSWCRPPARPSCGTRSEVRAMGRDTMGVRGMNVPPTPACWAWR